MSHSSLTCQIRSFCLFHSNLNRKVRIGGVSLPLIVLPFLSGAQDSPLPVQLLPGALDSSFVQTALDRHIISHPPFPKAGKYEVDQEHLTLSRGARCLGSGVGHPWHTGQCLPSNWLLSECSALGLVKPPFLSNCLKPLIGVSARAYLGPYSDLVFLASRDSINCSATLITTLSFK